jgi:hypothetical protein
MPIEYVFSYLSTPLTAEGYISKTWLYRILKKSKYILEESSVETVSATQNDDNNFSELL